MAVPSIDKALEQSRADCHCNPAVHLPVEQGGVQDAAGIVERDVFVDPHLSGAAVDFDAAKIEDEAVSRRAVDLVQFVGRYQARRSPEHRFAQGRRAFIREYAGRPVARPRDAGKAHPVFRVPLGKNTPAGEPHIFRPQVQLRRGDTGEFVPEAQCCEMSGTGDRAGEPARIVAGGNRPASLPVSRAVSTRIEAGLKANTSATTWAVTVRCPCPCGKESMITETPPSGSSATVAAV